MIMLDPLHEKILGYLQKRKEFLAKVHSMDSGLDELSALDLIDQARLAGQVFEVNSLINFLSGRIHTLDGERTKRQNKK